MSITTGNSFERGPLPTARAGERRADSPLFNQFMEVIENGAPNKAAQLVYFAVQRLDFEHPSVSIVSEAEWRKRINRLIRVCRERGLMPQLEYVAKFIPRSKTGPEILKLLG